MGGIALLGQFAEPSSYFSLATGLIFRAFDDNITLHTIGIVSDPDLVPRVCWISNYGALTNG